jgi:hypothetical protein
VRAPGRAFDRGIFSHGRLLVTDLNHAGPFLHVEDDMEPVSRAASAIPGLQRYCDHDGMPYLAEVSGIDVIGFRDSVSRTGMA